MKVFALAICILLSFALTNVNAQADVIAALTSNFPSCQFIQTANLKFISNLLTNIYLMPHQVLSVLQRQRQRHWVSKRYLRSYQFVNISYAITDLVLLRSRSTSYSSDCSDSSDYRITITDDRTSGCSSCNSWTLKCNHNYCRLMVDYGFVYTSSVDSKVLVIRAHSSIN